MQHKKWIVPGLLVFVAGVYWMFMTMRAEYQRMLHPHPTYREFDRLSRELQLMFGNSVKLKDVDFFDNDMWALVGKVESRDPRPAADWFAKVPTGSHGQVQVMTEQGITIYASDETSIGLERTPAGVICYEAKHPESILHIREDYRNRRK